MNRNRIGIILAIILGFSIHSASTQNNVTNAVGTESPEGALAGCLGSTFARTNGSSATTLYIKTSGSCGATGWEAINPTSTGVPAGSILMVNTGACPSTYTEVSALDGKTLWGTLNAHGDVGGTGGADNITPAGTNSGGAVNAHSGTAVADHASHTHTYTDVINHTHTINVTDPGHIHTETNNSATTGPNVGWAAQDTSTNTQSTTGYSTLSATTGITAASVNPGGGVATGTTAGPSATLTHSVTQPSNHSFTQPTFAGTSFDNRSAFMKVIFCKKD